MSTEETGGAAVEERREGRRRIWARGAYMLLFVVAFSLAQSLHTLIAVVQFIALLVWREPNMRIAEFGKDLAKWTGQMSAFLTCASNRRPWPFAAWPGG
jgi:hypothetical protein